MACKVIYLIIGAILNNPFDITWQVSHRNGHTNSHAVFANATEGAPISNCQYRNGTTCMYTYNEKLVNLNTGRNAECCNQCADTNTRMQCCSDVIPCTFQPDSHREKYVCIRTILNATSAEPGVLAIATCKQNSDENEKRQCLQQYDVASVDAYDVVPVTAVATREIYRNIHCAVCNGIDLGNIKFWKLKVVCESTSMLVDSHTTFSFLDISANYDNLLKTVSQTEGCNAVMVNHDPTMVAQKCSTVVEKCNVTGLWQIFIPTDLDDCAADETDLKVFKTIVFRNYACFACNVRVVDKMLHSVDGLHPPDGLPQTPSLSALLSFGVRTSSKTPQSHTCATGMVFVVAKARCMPARCSRFRRLQNDKCERVVHELEGFLYSIGFRLRPLQAVSVQTGYTLVPELTEQIKHFLESVFNKVTHIVYEVLLIADIKHTKRLETSDILPAALLHYEVRVKLQHSELHDPEQKLHQLIDLAVKDQLRISSHQGDRVGDMVGDLVDGLDDDLGGDLGDTRFEIMVKDDSLYFPEQSTRDKTLCSYTMSNAMSCSDINPRKSFKAYHTGNVTAIPYKGYNNMSGVAAFYLNPISSAENILDLRGCPFLQINGIETIWTEVDAGIEFAENGIVLGSADFVHGETANVIWVCLDTYNSLFSDGQGCYAGVYTVILTFISVIAILV